MPRRKPLRLNGCRQRQRQRSRLEGQMEGRAGTFERRWQVQDEGPRPCRGGLQQGRPGYARLQASRMFSATELRRARLGVEGIIYYDWKYVFEVDFANDVVRVKDAYLEYQGFKVADNPLLFRVGNFKTFNTFEEEPSARLLDTHRACSIHQCVGHRPANRCRHHVLLRPFWRGGGYLRPARRRGCRPGTVSRLHGR